MSFHPPRQSPTLTRRRLLEAGAALALAPGLARAARRADGRLNVLWLISDQHRPDVSGFGGNPQAATPQLDQLASEGTVISDVYCQVPLCVPARQSLLTARYAHDHGTFRNWETFPTGQVTIAKLLASAGYETALIGKSHCNIDGFSFVKPHNEILDVLKQEQSGLRLPGSSYYRAENCPYPASLAQMNPQTLAGEDDAFYMEEHVAAEAVQFLEAQRDATKPFFLWASFLNPHAPLFPPARFIEQFKDVELPSRAPLKPRQAKQLFRPDAAHRKRGAFDQLDAAELQGITRSYYACTAWMDACLAPILGALERLGLANDTLVVYTSDHGELLGDHGLLQKGSLYEGALRVPAILRLPGKIAAGRKAARVAEHLDLTRTVLDYAGVAPHESMAGRSLRRVLESEQDVEWDDRAISELIKGALLNGVQDRRSLSGSKLQLSVRRDNWKYFRYGDTERALFDLSQDPDELHNLIDDPERRVVARELEAELSAFRPKSFEALGDGRSKR